MVENSLNFVLGVLSCVIYCVFVEKELSLTGESIIYIIIIMQIPDWRHEVFSTTLVLMEHENYYSV